MAVRRGQRRVGWSAALAPTHTHTRTLTHTYTQTQKLIKAMCMFVSAGRGGANGPTRREGRKIRAERGARYVPTRNVS